MTRDDNVGIFHRNALPMVLVSVIAPPAPPRPCMAFIYFTRSAARYQHENLEVLRSHFQPSRFFFFLATPMNVI